MIGVISRILLRYGIGALVGAGLMSSDIGAALSGDPDVQIVVTTVFSIAAGAAVEGWYVLARRFGWST